MTRAELERTVDEVLQKVFGTAPGEIGHDQSFAGDLMAESLDYVDIGLHVSHALGISFDFAEAAEQMRTGGVTTIRVRDLVDYLDRQREA